MSDSPFLTLILISAGIYITRMWWSDLQTYKTTGRAQINGLPGATPAPWAACAVAAGGALVILAIETWGEIHLGISGEQSEITLLFGLYSLTAAVIEEIIFRGYIVVTHRGKAVKWAAVLGASLLFSALHPFLWNFETTGGFWNPANWEWTWEFTVKGWFSTIMVFISSLWFYTVRFSGFNPKESLLPCFAAHGAKNFGVILIKAAQGFVTGVF